MQAKKLLLFTSLLLLPFCAQLRAELIYATNGSVIVRFDSATPGTIAGTASVTGLQSGETIVGMDLRPANGLLYAVGSTSRLYTVNPLTGLAMQVGSSGAFTLSGTAFGTDFNPTVDRIRQISNTNQNLRLNPNDGSLTSTDGSLNPSGNYVAVAYTNNFAGASSTQLYTIDSVAGTLGLVGVANNGGPISTVGSLGLGMNLAQTIGFDISGLTAVAYSSITTGGLTRLYTINLATGAATAVGLIGDGTTPYLGLTAATAVPEPSSIALLVGAAGLFGVYRLRRKRS